MTSHLLLNLAADFRYVNKNPAFCHLVLRRFLVRRYQSVFIDVHTSPTNLICGLQAGEQRVVFGRVYGGGGHYYSVFAVIRVIGLTDAH